MGLDFGEYINADEIALTLPASSTRDADAQQESNRRRALCLTEGRSFSFETVMSHESKIDELRLAKAAGYEITFIGVSLERPELNVARVALRVSEGGHDVPTDRILARYERTMKLMPQAILIADRALIFDNSDSVAGPLLAMTACPVDFGALDVKLSAEMPAGSWVERFLVEGLLDLARTDDLRLRFFPPSYLGQF